MKCLEMIYMELHMMINIIKLAPINYSRLIDARLYAEQMYIDFRDEAPDFIKYIFYSDDITNSRIIVNRLQNMISVEE